MYYYARCHIYIYMKMNMLSLYCNINNLNPYLCISCYHAITYDIKSNIKQYKKLENYI